MFFFLTEGVAGSGPLCRAPSPHGSRARQVVRRRRSRIIWSGATLRRASVPARDEPPRRHSADVSWLAWGDSSGGATDRVKKLANSHSAVVTRASVGIPFAHSLRVIQLRSRFKPRQSNGRASLSSGITPVTLIARVDDRNAEFARASRGDDDGLATRVLSVARGRTSRSRAPDVNQPCLASATMALRLA